MNELLQEINSINNINRGGCGCSALAIYRYLQDRGIDTKICYFYSYDFEYHSNSARLMNNDFLEVPAHITLKYGDFFIDSRGFHLLEDLTHRYIRNYMIVTEKHLIETLNIKPTVLCTGWNDSFERKEVRKLEEITKVPLTDINIYDYLV